MQVHDRVWAGIPAKMHVLLVLLECGVLTIWNFILNELPLLSPQIMIQIPLLSPQIMIQISAVGTSLPCHVSCFKWERGTQWMIMCMRGLGAFTCCWILASWKISLSSGMYTNGVARISSPPDFKGSVSGTASPFKLVVTTLCACLCSLLSLVRVSFRKLPEEGGGQKKG